MLVLNIITSLNLLLLFCLLFFRKDNVLPNKLLALILVNPAINFISNINILSGNLENLPFIYFFAQITCFLFAPLVHMYGRAMMGKKINYHHPLYIITGMAMALSLYYALEFVFVISSGDRAAYIHGLLHEPYPEQMLIINIIFILMQQVYFTVLAIEVYRYRKHLRNTVSSYEKTKAIYIVRFVQMIWMLNIITVVLYGTLPMVQVEYIFLPIVLTVIYFFILYFSFHHHSIFTGESYQAFLLNNTTVNTSPAVAAPVAANTGMEEIARRVELHLLEKMSYTNPDLTINLLAEEMGLPAGKISTAINKILDKSFFELINEKRVERSSDLLKTRTDLTIEGIAYEAGFNSRAAFYRAFRKNKGITPSEFVSQS